MATMLEKYMYNLSRLVQSQPMQLEQVWNYQELMYRIEVLQVCQMLVKTAPMGTKETQAEMITHYHMFDGYFECIKNERRIGLQTDENIQKQRDTAYQNLCHVIADYRKRFQSYHTKTPEQYSKNISKIVSTVLPAWINLRNTYMRINSKEI